MHEDRFTTIPKGRGTSPEQQASWQEKELTPIDLTTEKDYVIAYISEIETAQVYDHTSYSAIVQKMSRAGLPVYSKPRLREAYLTMVARDELHFSQLILDRLTTKPIRTSSGVAPVTVLTKPYPCPGQCVFCPNDKSMPKSYLSNEPGAMRALQLDFDPYEQTKRRIEALDRTGHETDKIELLILGGTWSSYPEDYRQYFVRRCFDALNNKESTTLTKAQELNETAHHHNVGLVIETRPDLIDEKEIVSLRRMGVTRVQLGVQTINEALLSVNKRGHTADDTRRAIRLLRMAGFKIAIHWMPNLLDASAEKDYSDFQTLWQDPSLKPDEIKIYPTGLLEGTELFSYYEAGRYMPYDEETLLRLLIRMKSIVPPYCRINRIMRDIPSDEIMAGVKKSNFRQIIAQRMKAESLSCNCIRCREIRFDHEAAAAIHYTSSVYDTDHSEEWFIAAETVGNKLVGFIRLSLPAADPFIVELEGRALIRQLQVYGPSLPLDDSGTRGVQHKGIGKSLIDMARVITRKKGFKSWAVIAAVGTREYYRKQGFILDDLYMHEILK